MALEDISGYSLRRGLGSGSAGTVWLLRDLATGRHAVLKRIPKAAVAVKTDFLGDLELARTIDHPHVARLLEVRESDREWLLFSQYVAAGTLASLLERRGALSPGELVTLISPLAQGLSALHQVGLTHGHLGIDDIMFDADGRPVITDAGLRTHAPPSTPEADLAALGTIAHQAGGDPKTFPPSLFTTTGDLLAQQTLHRAHPLPIDLGFTHDHHPTPANPRNHSTPTDPATQQPSPPRPTNTPQPTPTTPRPTLATSRPAPDTTPPAPTPSSSEHSSPTESAAVQPITPPPTNPSQPTPATPRLTPTTSRSAPSATRSAPAASESGRLSRPTHRRSASRQSTRRQSARQFLRTKRAAYGILAACGAGAVVTVAIGLATLGVLGHPATSSTASADQSTQSTQPTPPPTPTAPRPTSTPPSAPHQRTQTAESKKWLQTLQALDIRRSRAFSTLNPADLNAIYVPGSPPWSADRALLTSYRDRHIRIEGLRMQIETVTVETPGKTTVVLRIVDRLISGVVVTPSGHRTALPPGQPTARRLTLTTNTTTWRISKITKA